MTNIAWYEAQIDNIKSIIRAISDKSVRHPTIFHRLDFVVEFLLLSIKK